MPSPKKVSPKKSSPKKTVSKPKSSPKKISVSSKPKMTDTHKAIAAASLLALLGGGSYAAYKNSGAISAAAAKAYNKVIASPAEAKKWLEARPQKIRDAYNTLKMKMKMPTLFGGKDAIKEESNLSEKQITELDNVIKVAEGKTASTTVSATV